MLRDGEISVSLSKSEVFMAAVVGVSREIEARLSNRTNRFPARSEAEAWGKHIVGALAEAAFAKASGLYWCAGVNTFTSFGDVGSFEVRWSPGKIDPVTKRHYPPKLKVRNDERDSNVVVLVSGEAPNFVVHGWRRASTAKRPEWLYSPREGPPAYFVPIDQLAPMYTLPGFAGRKDL